MAYTKALLSVMSSTEDSSVTSTKDSTVTRKVMYRSIFLQLCHLLKIIASQVLEKVLLPAMSYVEALLSVMSSTEDSNVTSTKDSTVTSYVIYRTKALLSVMSSSEDNSITST